MSKRLKASDEVDDVETLPSLSPAESTQVMIIIIFQFSDLFFYLLNIPYQLRKIVKYFCDRKMGV